LKQRGWSSSGLDH